MLNGNAGANRLDGGTGADAMFGGAGNDTYVIDNLGDRATETSPSGGIDTVEASVSYAMASYLENLTLTGTASIFGYGNAPRQRHHRQ